MRYIWYKDGLRHITTDKKSIYTMTMLKNHPDGEVLTFTNNRLVRLVDEFLHEGHRYDIRFDDHGRIDMVFTAESEGIEMSYGFGSNSYDMDDYSEKHENAMIEFVKYIRGIGVDKFIHQFNEKIPSNIFDFH